MIDLFITDLSTNNVYELPYLSISISEELNVGKDCRLSLDYYAIEELCTKYNTNPLFLLTSGIRQVQIKKNDIAIFLGVITDFNISEDNTGGRKIDIYAVGLFNLLAKRRTGAKRVFTSTDAGEIAWTLIDESQQSDLPYSDFGITEGLIQTSVDRDRTFRFANLKEEITQMSNKNLLNGFDFDIDNLGNFNVFYPTKGSQRPNLVLDDQNIVTWGVRKPLIMSLVNKVYVLGSGFNDDILYVTRESDNAYKATFKLLEEVLSARDIITTDTLNDKGDKLLADFQSPILGLTINHLDNDISILDYDVGDSLRVKLITVGIDDEYRRVYKRTIKIDTNEQILVQVDLK
jgi:hypothetical protein